MGFGLPSSGDSMVRYLIPLGVAVVVILLRNSRPRRLRIESLWILPAIYLVLLCATLYEAPPPVTPIAIGLLIAAFVVGAGIGWQRGRLMQIHIHPETHDMTSRASPIGLIFIFAVLVLRYAARDILASNAGQLQLPILAIGDSFIVLVVAMLSVQRVEVWRRASAMLAEARSSSGPPPPSSIVS